MKRLFVLAALLLGSTCVARAQWTAPSVANANGNDLLDLTATPATKTTLFDPLFPADALFPPVAMPGGTFATPTVTKPLALTLDTGEPAAASPTPKFVFGGRDDYRWQLAFGLDWIRFRSSIFNASAVGVRTAVTYYTNSWFGIEGSVSAAYAPEIFQKEHIKLLLYGAGPKVAWRQRQWEPWLHAIVGGAHEQPQTSAGGRNAFGLQLGGGADYRFNPRFSGRLQGDYVRTSFFSQSQNNFQLTAGLVIHF
jgi:opacity protein-like surface antigen